MLQTILIATTIVLMIINIILLVLHQKKAKIGTSDAELPRQIILLEQEIKNSLEREGKFIRETTTSTINLSNEILLNAVNKSNTVTIENVRELTTSNERRLQEMRQELTSGLIEMRKEINTNLLDTRKELSANFLIIRDNVDKNLKEVREDNNKQLEAMRAVVDEKLQTTLNERLNASFSLISERLESVYKGLGEMNSLASNVTDLKKVLTNVKTRGTWGEIQLDNLLENILAPEQYEKQFSLSKSPEKVDFAIILPGKENGKVYLPIDVKFPIEDYNRLVESIENSDLVAYNAHQKKLAEQIRTEARSIRDKYIKPPKTTAFAILYLPIEGLYAEVLRISGLVEDLQKNYNVIPSGPTTIAALLNSLQLGFKTLAIEKSSKEVFKILGTFKKDFENYVNILEKSKDYIDKAGREIDNATKKTNDINKRLAKVEQLTIEDEDVQKD